MQETRVQSLGGGKIPWRRKWQPIPVSFPWKIAWTEEPGGLQSMGSPEADTTERVRVCVHTHTHTPFRILVP